MNTQLDDINNTIIAINLDSGDDNRSWFGKIAILRGTCSRKRDSRVRTRCGPGLR